MKNESIGYVSVIALSLLRTIIKVIELLEAIDPIEPNEVKTGEEENGFACTIVVLSVLLLESAINRASYVIDGKIDRGIKPAKYFLRIVQDEDLYEQIDEIFAVRDAIVHNHLWTADVTWEEGKGLVYTSTPELIAGAGDKRFERVVDLDSRQTNRTGLNIVPSRIWRNDAYYVLSVVYNSLIALEELDRRYIYISSQHFYFNGILMPVEEIIESVC